MSVANSGSFTGSRGTSSSYAPYLKLNWNITQQDIANNRSLVELELHLMIDGYLTFSATKYGNLEGTPFNYYTNVSGSSTSRKLYSKSMWVSHDSDGTKSINFDGNFGLNITFSGVGTGTLYVSGTAYLDTIPRASKLNSFNMKTALTPDSQTTVELNLTRYSDSFDHDIYLKLGSTVIQGWAGQYVPTELTVYSGNVNTLLSNMSTKTAGALTLVVYTKLKNSNTTIGSYATRTDTVYIDGSVKPTISGLSTAIYGTSRDKTINKYVQSISRVISSFNRTAGYGASIVESKIIIRKVGGEDSQTINSNSGTTANKVLSSGTYEALAYVTDSRGRKDEERTTFVVYEYNKPKIVKFTAKRNVDIDTTVNMERSLQFSPLSTGNNTLSIVTSRKGPSGYWNSIQSTSTTNPTYTVGLNNTGALVTESYEYKIVVTDSFGNSAGATSTVSTARVVFDIHKNLGVGIGKLHQQGALDIAGDFYLNGKRQGFVNDSVSDDLNSITQSGAYRTGGSNQNMPSQLRYGQILTLHGSADTIAQMGLPYNSDDIFRRSGNPSEVGGIGTWRDWVKMWHEGNFTPPIYGSNSNGEWVKFNDGTLICWSSYHGVGLQTSSLYGEVYASGGDTWYFPHEFIANPALHVGVRRTGGGGAWGGHSGGLSTTAVTALRIFGTHNSTTGVLQPMAIGRWK